MVDVQEKGQSTEPIEELLTLAETTEMLGVSKQTLYRMMERGDLKGVKVGRQWRFRRPDLTAYLQRGPEAVVLSTLPLDAVAKVLDDLNALLIEQGVKLPAEEQSTNSREEQLHAILGRLYRLAAHVNASDIHLEPARISGDQYLLVRIRIDGVLHEMYRIPASVHPALFQTLKGMAGMNTEERSIPQDGRIHLDVDGHKYDTRVNVVPAVYGEGAVMRILDQSSVLIGLDRLGFFPDDVAKLRKWIHHPCGLVLCTGPTGSGKTTTLYSCLQEIARPEVKALTIEDPVEYIMPHTMPLQVNRRAGVTFPVALRAFMRQDPDIIMVGETRDFETAMIEVQAALTGHLLLSTMSCETAVSAITRLRDMGIEPFLITDALLGVMSQRLLRKACPHCKEPISIDPASFSHLRALALEGGYTLPSDATFYRGAGCQECYNRGYRGRTAIYELFEFTPSVKEAFLRGASVEELTDLAVEDGMHTLAADGIRKAVAGDTTIEEVLRVVS